MTTSLLALLLNCQAAGPAPAQPSVGLLPHSAGTADDGDVARAPIAYTTTYLLNKCGREVHRWTNASRASQHGSPLPDGPAALAVTYAAAVLVQLWLSK